MLWLWFGICGVTFAIGEYVSKRWALQGGWHLVVIMTLAYGLGSLAWLPIIKAKTELARMGMMWMVVASVTTVAIGIIVFGEKLTGTQWLGVVLAVVSMLLIGV